jgi:multiple sugar transport system permease protein
MTAELLFAVGTLLTWIGCVAVARGGYLGARLAFNRNAVDKEATQKGLFAALVLGGGALVLASVTPKEVEHIAEKGLFLPIVWFVMPFVAWAAVISLVFAGSRLVQAWFALNVEERNAKLRGAAGWGLALAVFVGLYLRDPDHSIQVLRGGIPFSGTFLVAALSLAAAAMVAMVLADRAARTRGIARNIGVQASLVAGCIVFGLPFAFLVITSFKEDRDMSSAEGIVWVPRVQETLPFNDPKNPLFEAQYLGQKVRGTILSTNADGTVQVDIERPLAIRGTTFSATRAELREVPREARVVTATISDTAVRGMIVEDLEDGRQRVQVLEPAALRGVESLFNPGETEPVRNVGLRVQNYSEALSFLPPETNHGLVYLKNTLLIVVLSVIGTLLSSSVVAYAFSRMNFPGRNLLFMILLSTMMLPAAVTLLPQFLIFRSLGWIDTLYPLWVPAFFASAFNVFLLRQFFMQIPMELEDASKIDGASYPRTFWSVMLPQIKPALAVIAIWTFMGAWNNFMGPLIYVNSPEQMPLSYALQLFQSDRGGDPGLLMAFATMTLLPVLLLFFFAQRYFIEGVALSGLGGR